MALRLALSSLILLEGIVTLTHAFRGQPDPLTVAFGGAEAVGAALLAWPRSLPFGACVLVCAFLLAAGVHVLERDWPFAHLVYAVAVLGVLAYDRSQRSPPLAA